MTTSIAQPSSRMEQRRILALNNTAVRLLQQRQHRQASQTFLQSLNRLKENLRMRDPKIVPVVEYEEDEVLHKHRPGCVFSTQPIRTASSTPATEGEALLPFDMFPHVFGLSSQHDCTSVSNRDGATAVLLYNMAATHHVQALSSKRSTPPKKQQILAQALQLYTVALSAVQHWDRHHEIPHEGHVLRCAILNNLAHVQAMLDRSGGEHKTLHCLREILRPSKAYLTRADYTFFVANVLFLCVGSGNRQDEDPQDEDAPKGLMVAPAAAA